MIEQRFKGEDFGPVYEMAHQYEELNGLEQLEDVLVDAAAPQPHNEYQQAVRSELDQILAEEKAAVVNLIHDLASNVDGDEISRQIDASPELEEPAAEVADLATKISRVKEETNFLFEAILHDATEDEKQVIGQAVERELENLNGRLEQQSELLSLTSRQAEQLLELVSRPLPAKIDILPTAEINQVNDGQAEDSLKLDAEKLGRTEFTVALLDEVLQELTDLTGRQAALAELSSPLTRAAAQTVVQQRLDDALTRVKELSAMVPYDSIEADLQFLRPASAANRQASAETARHLKADLHKFAGQLAEIVPFAKKRIRLAANQQQAVIRQAFEKPTLNQQEQSHLQALETIDSVIARPLSFPKAFELLIEAAVAQPEIQPSESPKAKQGRSVAAAAAERRRNEPRQKLVDYLLANLGKAVNAVQLACVIFEGDPRLEDHPNSVKAQTFLMIGAGSGSDKITLELLEKNDLVIQSGSYQMTGADGELKKRRLRVFRGLRASEFKAETHVGSESHELGMIDWETLDPAYNLPPQD